MMIENEDEQPQENNPNNGEPAPKTNQGLRIAAIILASVIAFALIILVGMVLAGSFDEEEPALTSPPPTGLPQFVTITQPEEGAVFELDTPVVITGEGGALFEGSLLVQVLDGDGTVLVQQPTIVQSPDAGTGGSGPWSVELIVPAGDVTPGTAGQVYAFAASPKDGSVVASDSVNISFAGAPPVLEGVRIEDHLWMLTSLNGNAVIDDTLVTLEFDGDQAVGLGGCNRYFTGFSAADNEITFGMVGSTMMFCESPTGVMEQESAYFNTLQEAAAYVIEGQQFSILNASGDRILTYDAAVVGTVIASEGVEFPADAVVKIRLDDVSLADAPAATIAEQLIPGAAQFPVSFSVVYDPAQVIETHSYGLNVRIEDAAGNLLLINTAAYNVITMGAPSEVDVQVDIVQ